MTVSPRWHSAGGEVGLALPNSTTQCEHARCSTTA